MLQIREPEATAEFAELHALIQHAAVDEIASAIDASEGRFFLNRERVAVQGMDCNGQIVAHYPLDELTAAKLEAELSSEIPLISKAGILLFAALSFAKSRRLKS